MNIKNLVVPLIGILAVAALWIGITNSRKEPTIVEKKTLPVGALAGPDIPYNYLSIGGLITYYAHADLAATSSVPCALQSPSSTSTLAFWAARVDSNGLGAITFDVSTSSTAYGSSSPSFILANTIAANAKDFVSWSGGIAASTTNSRLIGFDSFQPSVVTGESGYVIPPNTWLNMRVATGTTPGTFANYLTGSCGAGFRLP